MTQEIPRIVIAGTNSGCGKTTVTCAVLQALCSRGMQVGAFKCGPDYIDPMFHSRIIGAKSANLDLFFFPENTARYLLAKNSRGCGISVIEGVMGFYDGLRLTAPDASTYAVSQATESPVVLVVNAKGASLSVLAVIQGFLTLYPENRIAGVILNQCSAMTYPPLKKAMEERFQGRIKPLGYFPRLPECALESRHLGLVTADEVVHLKEKMQLLAQQAEKSLDLDGLLALARSAPKLSFRPVSFPLLERGVRIAVARDPAFCFYYGDNLAALAEMGGEPVFFSPLHDAALPEGIHGLYLGGGYPELYARQLSENTAMRHSIRSALERGLPCIAECGGFMYLTQAIENAAMVGYLPGTCRNAGRLTRFGYVTLTAKADCLLCPAGGKIPAHEFHYWDATETGSAFRAVKPSGLAWDCAFSNSHLYAGYPHFHFYANPDAALRFYQTCMKEKHRYAGTHQAHGD